MRRHVTFTQSTAYWLRLALCESGCDEEILTAPYGLDVGPISVEDDEVRARWMQGVMAKVGREQADQKPSCSSQSLRNSSSEDLLWVSRFSSAEYAGFLWWLSHAGDAPMSITEIETLDSSSINAGSIDRLLARATPVTVSQRASYKAQWGKLRHENAPMRVMKEGALVSVGEDYFDGLLTGLCKTDWTPSAKIVGRVFDEFSRSGVFQASDLTLQARLVRLASDGKLEARGDSNNMRAYEVRLPCP